MRRKRILLSIAAILLLTFTSAGLVLAAPGRSNPSGNQVAAIESVIQKANQEQVQAIASGDPTVMQDTATASYYQQAAQGVSNLASSGVKAIQLVNLQWGPVTLQSATTAQATTHETWGTTFTDGSTLQETDTNVYTLVLQNGAWKVQDDQHPNTSAQPAASSSKPAAPFKPAAVSSSDSQSSNWAGYAATGGTFSAVSGAWTVPAVPTANSAATDATWVGIGGVTTHDLIQAGTQAVVQGGQVQYWAWYETLPQAAQQVPLNVNAGDSVSVSITQQAPGTWQVRISDATNQQTWQDTVSYTSSLSSAEWIEEAPLVVHVGQLPLDNFGRVTFTSASAVENGHTTTLAGANAQPIVMSNGAGQALAQASVLNANGSSFIVARTSAPATSAYASRGRFGGFGGQGSGSQGFGGQGSGSQGFGGQGFGSQGFGSQGFGSQP